MQHTSYIILFKHQKLNSLLKANEIEIRLLTDYCGKSGSAENLLSSNHFPFLYIVEKTALRIIKA